ncbi:MAG: hypothetical protein WCO84_06925, partial [bacterium]
MAAITVFGTTLDEVPYTTQMWSVADPFGLAVLRTTVKTNQTITVGNVTKPLSGNLVFPSANGISASTGTNIAQTVVGTHDESLSSHSILFDGKLGTNNATYLATVASASNALKPSDTNNWQVGAHLDWLLTSSTVGWTTSPHLDWILASSTNGWTVSPHSAWLTFESDPYLIIHSTNETAHSLLFGSKADVIHNHAWSTITNPPSSIATALQPSNTNGWQVSSHLNWLLSSATNGWEVGAHLNWLTAETDSLAIG